MWDDKGQICKTILWFCGSKSARFLQSARGENDQRGGWKGGFLKDLPSYKAITYPVTLQPFDYISHSTTVAVGSVCSSLVDLNCQTVLI